MKKLKLENQIRVDHLTDYFKSHSDLIEKWIGYCEDKRETTENLDEFLFWLMKDITFNMASRYELENRIPNQDSRRSLFQTQLNLLKRIRIDFHDRMKEEINKILIEHPYNDIE